MTMIGSVSAEKLLGMQIDLNTKLRSGALTIEEFEEFLNRRNPFGVQASTTNETPLLEPLGTAEVAAVEEFDISDHFRKNNPYGVKVTYVGDNFKKIFGKKTEKNVAAATLKAHRLTRGAKNPEIIKNLGEGHRTFLAQLWALVLLQPNGPDSAPGILLTNGNANIFEVPNPENPEELWTVFAYWNDGWKFNANPISNPNDWNADNQVFGRNYFFSPTAAVGVFASKPFFQPPTILPTSTNGADRAVNFLLSMALSSQAICKKNLSESSLTLARWTITGLCSLDV